MEEKNYEEKEEFYSLLETSLKELPRGYRNCIRRILTRKLAEKNVSDQL